MSQKHEKYTIQGVSTEMQDKLFPVLRAHEMLTLGQLRGSWLQLLQCLGITASKIHTARLWELLLG